MRHFMQYYLRQFNRRFFKEIYGNRILKPSKGAVCLGCSHIAVQSFPGQPVFLSPNSFSPTSVMAATSLKRAFWSDSIRSPFNASSTLTESRIRRYWLEAACRIYLNWQPEQDRARIRIITYIFCTSAEIRYDSKYAMM